MNLNRIQSFQKALLLFFNFFIIILAYYQVKPASRAFFLEFLGSDSLPYLWIGSALTLGAFMPVYYKLVNQFRRHWVLLFILSLSVLLLFVFNLLLHEATLWKAVSFYIFVDIFSVVLVEQFWSLASSSYGLLEGKKWYGFIGSGGLVGGIVGGFFASTLIKKWEIQTLDLLWISSLFLFILVPMTLYMVRKGWYKETPPIVPINANASSKKIFQNPVQARYLFLITLIMLLAQVAEPIIEYQFMQIVEKTYLTRDARTAYLSGFLSMLGMVALSINLLVTPLVHRFLGTIAGLTVQPLAIAVCSFFHYSSSSLFSAAALKISDRGLSYSINRASKELLYVPMDASVIYKAKAWVDMFGYRLFKVIGSLLILLLTKKLFVSSLGLSSAVWFIAAAWILCIFLVRFDYKKLAKV